MPTQSWPKALLPLLLAGVLAATTAACGGLPKTAAQNAADDRQSKAAQALRMAETIREQGDAASAQILYARAVALDPNRLEAIVGLARASVAAGDAAEAVQAYGLAAAQAPQDPDLAFEYGRALLALGRSRDATEQMARYVRARPADPRGYSLLGVAHDTAGEHRLAQSVYLDGLEVAPEHAGLRNNLALSLAFAGAFADSAATLEELAGEPTLAGRVRLNLALVQVMAGQVDAAARILATDLGDARAQRVLATYRSLQGVTGPALARAVLSGQLAQAAERPATGSRPLPGRATARQSGETPLPEHR
jgi:Flp pilus assembly protein TadD